MGQSLSETAVRGLSKRSTLSPEQVALLTEGDIEGVLAFHSSVFGSAVMRDEDDEDDDQEDDDSDADADDEDDDDQEEDDEDQDEETDADKSKKLDRKDRRIIELADESKKNRLKASQRGKKIRELEAEVARLKAGKAKPKGDDEEGDEDQSGAQSREDEARTQREHELLIKLEFSSDDTYAWKDKKAALKLLDTSDIEIDDDEVIGLDDAVKQLAETYPFLLAETAKEKQERKSEQQRRSQGRTGQATKTRSKGRPADDKLRSKYNLNR